MARPLPGLDRRWPRHPPAAWHPRRARLRARGPRRVHGRHHHVAQPRGIRRLDRHPAPRRPDQQRGAPSGHLPADHPLRGARRLPQPARTHHLRPIPQPSRDTRGGVMKWITRARPKTDRIACPWLITKFIDPAAEILYVPAGQVLDEAQREDAVSFDAPGARYDHRDGKCTFEVLIDEYDLGGDPALMRLARIVHAADIAADVDTDPAGPGLLAIGLGGLDVEADDHRLLDKGRFVYDALYAWCQH